MIEPYISTEIHSHTFKTYGILTNFCERSLSLKKVFPSLPNQTLTAFTPHLSVIPGFLVLRGPQACQTSSSPTKKYPSSRHNPPVPPPTSPPSLLGPPNKNKVTVNREWPGLLLCRSVSGYLIVTHGLGP